jgi:SAM-dependent methyltransferase
MTSLLRKLFYAIAYLGNPPWDTGISPPELLDFIRSHKPGCALDMGCGTGTNLLTLVEHGWQAVGVELSGRAVRLARKRLARSGWNTSVYQGDVSRPLPFEGNYSLILDIGCYHDLDSDDKSGYRMNVRERLVEGGFYLAYGHWLTPQHAKGTGVDEHDIQAFSTFLKPVNIQHTTDRWERHTVWMTFEKRAQST